MGPRRAAPGMQMAGYPDDEKNYNLFLLSKTKCRRAFLFHPTASPPHPPPHPSAHSFHRFFFYFPPFPRVFKGKSAGVERGKDPERSFNQLILFLHVHTYIHARI